MIKIALVNPPVLGILEPWYDEPEFGRTALAYLAGYLRDNIEIEILVLDSKFEKLNFEKSIERLYNFKPDIIGLTAFTNEIKPAAYLAAKYKSLVPKCLTIIGGVHITAIPEETLKEFESFDIGVVGEGEITLLEICKSFEFNSSFENINGIVYRELNGEIKLTTPRLRILDQDSIPLPAWDLLPKAKTYFVQTLRGCPLNCQFCMNPNGRIARKRSVENVMLELKWILNEFSPSRISFGDEIFSVDMVRTKLLLDEFTKIDFGSKVKWDVQTHVRYVDKELFKKFKLAKVERVELGIETGDEDLLKKMGKGTTLKMILDAVKLAKIENVKIGTFFLLGQPNETIKTLKRTLKLAIKINPHIPMFGVMTPYPGTEIARMAANEEGGYKILSMDWDEYNKQIGGAISFAKLNRSQIEWFQLKSYLLVYLYNFRLRDFLFFCWEYKFLAYKVLKKIIFRKDKIIEFYNKPLDYDIVLNSKVLDKNLYVTSRENWKLIQKKELLRNKEEFKL